MTSNRTESLNADDCSVPPPPRTDKAPSPFNREDSDFIIRTSDNVDFYVHRPILVLGSPVFEAMLSFPQPAGSDPIRPHVDVSEDSKTMDAFLRLLYPVLDPQIESLPHLRQVLAAGTKYEACIVIMAMREVLTGQRFIEEDPLRVFAIACLFRMEAEAKVAAEAAVVQNQITGAHCPELDEIPAGAYYRLLQLNRTRERVTSTVKKKVKPKSSKVGVVVSFFGIKPFCHDSTMHLLKPDLEHQPGPFNNEGLFTQPSDTLPRPDMILTSADGHEFHIHWTVISLASPTMLSLLERDGGAGGGPALDATDADPLPRYRVKENASILSDLLHHCYPFGHRSEDYSDPRRYLSVLSAARRYRLCKVEEIMRAQWSKVATKEPLRFYFVAAEYGWKKEALYSARELIRRTDRFPPIEAQYIPEMETIANASYYRLLSYFKKCTNAAASDLAILYSLPSPPCRYTVCTERFPSAIPSTAHPPPDLSNPFSTLNMALKSRPCGAAIAVGSSAARSFIEFVASDCFRCASPPLVRSPCSTTDRILWAIELLRNYGTVVDAHISKVALDMVITEQK